jgi:periplasmic divalent cation tolerance protein
VSEPVLIVFSTAPDEPTAERLGRTLVEEGLVACVNRLPAVRSWYLWEGRLQDEAEILLMMKTTAQRWPALEARLKSLHPYDVPEMLAVPVQHGNEPYLQRVRTAVREKSQE